MGRIHRRIRDRDADEMDQDQTKTDGDRRKARRGTFVGSTEDNQQKHHRRNHIGHEGAGEPPRDQRKRPFAHGPSEANLRDLTLHSKRKKAPANCGAALVIFFAAFPAAKERDQ
jgi:hypothetical protein